MHCLSRSDTDQDAQNLDAGDPLSERWVEARTTLFDSGEVESGGVSDELQVQCRSQVLVGSRYGGGVARRGWPDGAWGGGVLTGGGGVSGGLGAGCHPPVSTVRVW